jgi:hypothetical protein
MNELVFYVGECQHFVREESNPESRLIYRGELVEIRR